MAETTDTKIRRWLLSKPGPFIHEDYNTVLRLAHDACGCGGTVEDFASALKRVGRVPQHHRVGQGHGFILALPARGANDSAKPYDARNSYSAGNAHVRRWMR